MIPEQRAPHHYAFLSDYLVEEWGDRLQCIKHPPARVLLLSPFPLHSVHHMLQHMWPQAHLHLVVWDHKKADSALSGLSDALSHILSEEQGPWDAILWNASAMRAGNWQAVLALLHQQMGPGGFLLWSCLDSTSFPQAFQAWLQVAPFAKLASPFSAVERVLQDLVATGWQDTVCDRTPMALEYPSLALCVREWQAWGLTRYGHVDPAKAAAPSLTPRRWRAWQTAYPRTEEGLYPLDLDWICGIAWAVSARGGRTEQGVSHIPVAAITRTPPFVKKD